MSVKHVTFGTGLIIELAFNSATEILNHLPAVRNLTDASCDSDGSLDGSGERRHFEFAFICQASQAKLVR